MSHGDNARTSHLISHANTYLIFLSLLHKGQLDTFYTSTPRRSQRGRRPLLSLWTSLFVNIWELLKRMFVGLRSYELGITHHRKTKQPYMQISTACCVFRRPHVYHLHRREGCREIVCAKMWSVEGSAASSPSPTMAFATF